MLDFNNVILQFQELSGCDIERINGLMPMIESSVYSLENLLDKERILPSDLRRCEYAAACMANYDFVCLEAGRDNIICTAEGKAVSSEDLTKRIAPALELKISALSAIGGLLKNNDFLFRTI